MNIAKKIYETLQAMPSMTTDEVAKIPGRNGNRTYKYMGLSTLLAKVRKVLSEHGLALTQSVVQSETSTFVDTKVTDGDETVSLCQYPVVPNTDPQAFGSQITYARRYSIYSAFGIYPDKDDDGAAASNAETYITPMEWNSLKKLCEDHGADPQALASEWAGHAITSPSQITGEVARNMRAQLLS